MIFSVIATKRDHPEQKLSTGVSVKFIVQFPEADTLTHVLQTLFRDDVVFKIEKAKGSVDVSIGPLCFSWACN